MWINYTEWQWINGKPRLGQPINYPKGEIPEFKSKEINILYTKNEHILMYPKYESIKEFTESLIDGREIEIEWNGIHYTIEYEGESQNNFSICEAYKPETETHFNSVEKLLNSKIKSGEYLKDIILKAEIKWRNL